MVVPGFVNTIFSAVAAEGAPAAQSVPDGLGVYEEIYTDDAGADTIGTEATISAAGLAYGSKVLVVPLYHSMVPPLGRLVLVVVFIHRVTTSPGHLLPLAVVVVVLISSVGHTGAALQLSAIVMVMLGVQPLPSVTVTTIGLACAVGSVNTPVVLVCAPGFRV